jgi:hypothetical protein
MDRWPLPVLDPTRTEFGFERTRCACPECTRCCHHILGYLMPADLPRIAAFHRPGLDLFVWARLFLLASPGALVARKGVVYRIPTLVPARRPDGACIFLTEADSCSIHPAAPYGCAFFDAHMTAAQADHRSSQGLRAFAHAWQAGTPYGAIWQMLYQAGRIAPLPEQARQQLRQASSCRHPRS